MTRQSTWQFTEVPPANVAQPATGYYSFFLSDGSNTTPAMTPASSPTTAGSLYKMDSSLNVTALIQVAYSNQNAQDAVGSILTNSPTVTWVYDSVGHTITATVPAGSITATQIANLTITNALISNAAAIAYTKLNLTASIVNNDIAAAAGIALSKLAAQADQTIVGNVSGGAAAPVALTTTQVLTALGLTTAAKGLSSLTAAVTIAGSALEQTLTGVLSLPANFWQANTTVGYEIHGYATQTAAATTMTFKTHLGAAGGGFANPVPAQSGKVTANTAKTNIPFKVSGLITCRTAGAAGTIIGGVIAEGPLFDIATASAVPGILTAAPTAINTTAASDLQVSLTNSVATLTGVITAATFTLIKP